MGEPEVSAAAAAALFASKPRSFRMDRRSAGAASLKAAVSRKLVDFLGNYTDDVLAEYIVVLVCNGKHQNQARDDLEAFLGDDSKMFVAWLWHHLSEETFLVKVPTCMHNQKADAMAVHNGNVGKEQKNGTLTNLQMRSTITSDPPQSQERKHGASDSLSVLNSKYDPNVTADIPRRSVGMGLAVANNDLREHLHQIDSSCGPNNENNNKPFAYKATRVCSVEGSVGDEQCLQLEDFCKKIGSSKSNDMQCESPKQQPNARNLRSVLTDDSYSRHQSLSNVASGRLPPEATDSMTDHNVRPRGSVWDRLGKTHQHANVLMNERSCQLGPDVSKKRKLEPSREGFDKRRLAPPVSSRLGKRLLTETTSVQNSVVSPISSDAATENKEMGTVHDIVSFQKKRYIEEKGPPHNGPKAFFDRKNRHLEDKETHQSLQGSLSANGIHKQGLEQATAENRPPSDTVQQSSKYVKVLHNLRRNVFQLQSRLELSVPTSAQDPAPVDRSAQSKPDSLSNPEHVIAGHKPVDVIPLSATTLLHLRMQVLIFYKCLDGEVLNMKERLHQIERKMLELRSKQTSMSTDSKSTACQVSSLKNCPEQDSDVRTVFVTNVHFAAPKEALSSHFSQCGPVVRTVLVTDAITGQPKGSAYIHFASKESADKAISLNGTSFFSRKLEVTRKTDVPAGVLALNQVPGRSPQPWFSPQSQGKSPFQRQFSGHLQWKRDQASGGSSDNSALTPTTQRLQTSDSAI